jgi:hypothetical protein
MITILMVREDSVPVHSIFGTSPPGLVGACLSHRLGIVAGSSGLPNFDDNVLDWWMHNFGPARPESKL